MPRMKFQDQLRKSFIGYVSFLLILVLLLYLSGFLLNFFAVVVRSNRECNRNLSQVLSTQYSDCEIEMETLSNMSALQAVLTDPTDTSLASVSASLYQFVNAQTFRSYFSLTDWEGNTVCSSFNQQNATIFASSIFLSSAIARLDKFPGQMLCFVCTAPLSSNQECCYSFCRSILDPGGETVGYLFFNLRTDSFRNYLRDISQDVLVTDAYDNIIYTTLDLAEDPSDKFPSGKLSLGAEGGNLQKLEQTFYYIYGQTITPQKIQVYTLTSLEAQVRTLGYSVILFCLLFFLLIVIVQALTRTFARRNAGEISELTTAVDELGHGNMSYELSPKCSEEFHQLYQQFKQLVRTNNQLLDRRRLMEVKHLEEQFNPHFVFNVMETVRYQIGENPDSASEMLLSFANLMRYSINYGQTKVTLETDVEYINDYLLLQKIRYNNCLHYEFRIPDELLEYRVPKLLLQPVIENSIKHGFRQNQTLNILVVAERIEGNLRFIVEDNGVGISPQRLDAIRESFSLELDSGLVSHIGLYNVQKVLSLLYGPDYGLQIESSLDNGTRVTLTMPCEMEE